MITVTYAQSYAALGLASADVSASGRRAAFKRGNALPPPSPGAPPGYPITDANHWERARQAVGRVKDPARRASLARLLRKTAPQFGKQKALAGSWAAPGGSSMANYGHQVLSLADSSLTGSTVRPTGTAATDGYDAGASHRTIDQGEARYCANCGNDNDLDARYCDNCGQQLPASNFGHGTGKYDAMSARVPAKTAPELLRTPQLGSPRSAGMRPDQIPVGSVPGHNARKTGYGRQTGMLPALSNTGQRAIGLARPMPISRPDDIIIGREGGRAIVRDRRGGGKIGEIYRSNEGWVGVRADGTEMDPTTQQRASLFGLIGWYNHGGMPAASQGQPLQPPPQQTPLMAQFGIPAIRALATPMHSSSDGTRMASSGGDGDGDDLPPRARAIYRKLCARGMSKDRAMQFARNADRR